MTHGMISDLSYVQLEFQKEGRENDAENILAKGMPKNSPKLWNTQIYRVKKPGKLQTQTETFRYTNNKQLERRIVENPINSSSKEDKKIRSKLNMKWAKLQKNAKIGLNKQKDRPCFWIISHYKDVGFLLVTNLMQFQ